MDLPIGIFDIPYNINLIQIMKFTMKIIVLLGLIAELWYLYIYIYVYTYV